jgi:hypothetical protein
MLAVGSLYGELAERVKRFGYVDELAAPRSFRIGNTLRVTQNRTPSADATTALPRGKLTAIDSFELGGNVPRQHDAQAAKFSFHSAAAW